MVVLAVLASLLAQGPLVTVGLSRDEVAVGGQLELTIVVETVGSTPPEITPLSLERLELVDVRERRSVRFVADVAHRTLTRVFTLRAVAPGVGRVAPITVTHEGASTQTAGLPITVSGTGPAAAVSDALRRLLLSAVPERSDSNRVALTLVVEPESLIVGQQADVVLAAWFPREIRTRIRSQPTIDIPQIRGAWVYQRPTPAGVAMTRMLGGRAYDIFVVHLAAFPLTAGGMEVGRGSVSYSLPLTFSFLSREVRMEVASAPRVVQVTPLPTEGRSAAFTGATGVDLALDVEVSDRDLPLGGAARVEFRLRGHGNVALWPEPEIRWPPTIRAYPQDVGVQLDAGGERIGGTKSFHYLVVPDTSGAHRIPGVRYDYFDVGAQSYATLGAAPIEFATQGVGGAPLIDRNELLTSPTGLITRVPISNTSVAIAAAAALMFALGFRVTTARARGEPRDQPKRREPVNSDNIRRLMEAVRAEMVRRVPDAPMLSVDELATALRAAGVEHSLAMHAARVRDRLQHAVFGPAGVADAPELELEATEVLKALRSSTPAVGAASSMVVLMALVFGGASALSAQSAEALYEAGAVREAADSFARRAEGEPTAAHHWYNLGIAREAMGERGRAGAALLRAVRLAPRNGVVRRRAEGYGILGRGPTWVSPATPKELLAVGLVVWIAGCVAVALRARLRWVAVLGTMALGCFTLSQAVRLRYEQQVGFVTVDRAQLRAAPYGPSSGPEMLGPGDAVAIRRRQGAFVLVEHGERSGWLQASEVETF